MRNVRKRNPLLFSFSRSFHFVFLCANNLEL
jgi:hypothetical protein